MIFRRFSVDNKERVWINPGFLCGPCLPLYGLSFVMLYLISCAERFIKITNPMGRKAVLLVLMTAGITLVELVAGEVFILRRHIKLWDYSDMRFNYKGIVCVRYTLYWTGLCAVYYHFVHPHIVNMLEWYAQNPTFSFFLGAFYGILTLDVIISFELTAKIKAFAVENRMVIRYEELKKHIRAVAEQQKERYLVIRASEITHSLKEVLTGYMEKQKEQAKHGRLNDFIDEEEKTAAEAQKQGKEQ